MRGFGVKDGERDTYVAWIEAAHAEGQIGEADRDLRVARARGAETRDELVTLTRDLRPVSPRPVFAPAPRQVSAPVRTSRWAGGALAGVGVFLVVVGGAVAGVVALLALAVGSGEQDSGTSSGVAPAVVDVGSSDVASRFRRVVDAYEQQFGSTTARTLVMGPDGVVVHVPLPARQSRTEEWSLDDDTGAWLLVRMVDDDAQVVDLAGIDLGVMAANADAAGDLLGRRVAEVDVAVADPGSGPRVTIEVRSRRGAAVRLVTTPGGDVLDGPTRS